MDKTTLKNNIDSALDLFASTANNASSKKELDRDTQIAFDNISKSAYHAINEVAEAVKAILETL